MANELLLTTPPDPKADARTVCPNCGGAGMRSLYAVSGIPVHSTLQMSTYEQAVNYPRGDLRLAVCDRCGFVCNALFNPAVHEYSPNCEESQGFSPTFNAFAKSLAQKWVDRHGLRRKTVLEIGCGKGEFLILLCEAGENQGIGIDPSYQAERTPASAAGRVRFIQDFYSEKYADMKADCVLCRHTLEHIGPTGEFLRMVRRAVGDRTDTLVLFELPDVVRVLKERAFWDIYYEHCSYFSPGSLARLFRAAAFEVVELERAYDDQYLLIGARPAAAPTKSHLPMEDDMAEMRDLAESFRGGIQRLTAEWRRRIDQAVGAGRKVVVWGSLSKGVAFLTTLKLASQVQYVVDINPYRQGKYMPGTGQKIVAPAFLAEYRPDVVIAMNPIYRREIQRDLDGLGVKAELLAVGED